MRCSNLQVPRFTITPELVVKRRLRRQSGLGGSESGRIMLTVPPWPWAGGLWLLQGLLEGREVGVSKNVACVVLSIRLVVRRFLRFPGSDLASQSIEPFA
jgi:hypothetical protein